MNYTKTILLATLIVASSFSPEIMGQKTKKTTSLKSTFKKDFLIGTALNGNQINEKNATENTLIVKEFNCISPENIMKSEIIHPEKDRYDFSMADKYVAFGKKNKMFVHGHTLIWHSQLSAWIAKIDNKDELTSAMTTHINTIVSRYKGKIGSWDVVNEALNEDGTTRKSVFSNVLGDDFLTLAFQLASKADPKVDLYYNDYNLCDPKKRKGAVELVKTIQKNGAKIDGVGEQGHWNLITPSLEEIEKTILDFSALGVKVAFTELDITVLPNPWDLVGADVNQNFEGSEKMNPYPKSLPDEVQNQLAQRYEAIFKLFLKHKDKISRVTFWGTHDGQSWLNDWPIKGRTNYPLLFDTQLKPKKSYFSILATKK